MSLTNDTASQLKYKISKNKYNTKQIEFAEQVELTEQIELMKKFNEIYTDYLNFLYIFSDSKKIFNSNNINFIDIARRSIWRQCNICFDEIKIIKSTKICINPLCETYVCEICAKSIFDLRDKVGKNVSYTQTVCPICKCVLSNIENIPFVPKETLKYTDKYYTAWCQSCRHLKKSDYMKCDDIEEYNIEDFICNDCMGIDDRTGKMYRVKDCPSCHVKISKNLDGSCNHVSCFNCKKHVCFFQDCENFFDKSDECYSHMRSTHGNIYDGNNVTRQRENFFDPLPNAFIINLRGNDRFAAREGQFFNYVQPAQPHRQFLENDVQENDVLNRRFRLAVNVTAPYHTDFDEDEMTIPENWRQIEIYN